MAKRILLTGNEACVEGALLAGCRFYAGYPITPQNELIGYMSRRMDEVGGSFLQGESEIASINMVFGAAVVGARAMTSSSSPGISLKQEGISYLAACRLPAVIVNVARGGPGLGNIAPSQADYFQATKGGGHGDYRCIVLAPSSVQEMFDLTAAAFGLADRYRIPVIVLSDGMIAQMREPVEMRRKPSGEENSSRDRSWVLGGARNRPSRRIRSLFLQEEALETLNEELQNVYRTIEERETQVELINARKATIFLVAYGLCGRIAKGAVEELKKEGYEVGLIRPITLWPFPTDVIRQTVSPDATVLVVEMSAGQMVEDVRLAVEDRKRIHFLGRMGGAVPRQEDVVRKVKTLYEEQKKSA